jgi:hypothetical protein
VPYNRNNYLKRVRHVVAIYNSVKNPDKPDTDIVRLEFPKHNIHISYRTWMIYKGISFATETAQLCLFN